MKLLFEGTNRFLEKRDKLGSINYFSLILYIETNLQAGYYVI